MNIINMKIADIRPYKKNPRHNEGAVEAVARSIKEFGWQQPIVVDKDMVVIVGHTRLKAAEQLGLTEVPVVVADHLTPEQVQAYRIADNKTGELAEWDYALLPMELKDLQNADFDRRLYSRLSARRAARGTAAETPAQDFSYHIRRFRARNACRVSCRHGRLLHLYSRQGADIRPVGRRAAVPAPRRAQNPACRVFVPAAAPDA